jgi:hypothetical protein
MTIGILIVKSTKHRALALLTALFIAGILLSAPCRVLAATVAPSSHDCCEDHCSRDEKESHGCETLCAAKSSKVLISPLPSVDLAPATGSVVAPGQHHHGRAQMSAAVDPVMTDSSPPLYIQHAAFLI